MWEERGEYTSSVNFWPSFVDISIISVLLLIVLYFAQLVANAEVFELARIHKKQQELECRLKQAIRKDPALGEEVLSDIKFTQMFREHQITFSDHILFKTAEATLQERGRRLLATVGSVLLTSANDQIYESIEVDGHTDDVPIHTHLVQDNWALASNRATEVVRFFDKQTHMDPSIISMSAVGFSKFQPRMSFDEYLQKNFDDSAVLGENERQHLHREWRSQNRRVEMKLYYNADTWAGDDKGYVGCEDPKF
jgi:flagellar motor protein MotB